jgi:hypothetical protein
MYYVQQGPDRSTTITATSVGQEIRERWYLLSGVLDRLLDQDEDGDANIDDLHAAELLLQTLPLASEPFGVAMNRLRNAYRYFEANEPGAAQYELRLLGGGLRSVLTDQVS